MPAIRPPPPTGTNTADRSPGLWRRISSPIVPCPAMTSGSSNGWMNVSPVSRHERVAVRLRVGVAVAGEHDLGAHARAPPRTLISGVVCGITITARMPSRRAEKATPCAWLPALAAMTPRARSASVRWAIRL